MDEQHVTYVPQGGVCSKLMVIDAVEGVIKKAEIVGGCHGNGQGVCALLKDMPVKEAIRRMEGIDCHARGTSCPDQMAQALKQLLHKI